MVLIGGIDEMTVGILDTEAALTTEIMVEELIEVVLGNGVVLDEEFNKGKGGFVGITLVATVLITETGIFTDEEVLGCDVAVYVSVTGDTTLTLAVCNVVAGTVTLTMRGKSLEDVELNVELGPETDV
jgi:hypothetical protein